jgi:DNA-directed RNA polymerase specialized sigma subunit
MKEIGRVLQLTEARICQLHAQSIHRLKARMQTLLD